MTFALAVPVQEHHNPFVYKLVGVEALRSLCAELTVPQACVADLSTSAAASAERLPQTASPSLTASQQAPTDDAGHTKPRPDSALVDDGNTEPYASGAHTAAAGAGPGLTHSRPDRGATVTAGLASGRISGQGPASTRVGSEVTGNAAQQQQQQQGPLLAGGSPAQALGARARRQQHILARLAELCGDDLEGVRHLAAMPATPARQHRASLLQPDPSSALEWQRPVHSAGFHRQRRERHLDRLLRAVEARTPQQADEVDGSAPGSVPARRVSGVGRRRFSDALERARSMLEPHPARPREVAQPQGQALQAERLPGDSSGRPDAAAPFMTAAGYDGPRRRRPSRHAGEHPTLLQPNSAPAEGTPQSLQAVGQSVVGMQQAENSNSPTAAAAEDPVGLIADIASAAVGNRSQAAALEAIALLGGIAMGASAASVRSTSADPPHLSVAAAAAGAGRAMADDPPVPESSPEPERSSAIVANVGDSDSGAPGSASDAATEPAPQEMSPDTVTDDDPDLIMLSAPEPTMVDLTVLVRRLFARF